MERSFAFIVGSPRSGTTILENILNCHDEIAEFYEPYYVWERFLNVSQNDVWNPQELTASIADKIRRDYTLFGKKSKKRLVLDKLPTHSFNIPVIQKVFPSACWIHILRDGRDVALSIRKEWHKREKMVQQKDVLSLLKTTKAMLGRQPFLRYKAMALSHELKSSFSLNPKRYFNKSRWEGYAGWGPRFDGWKECLTSHSRLQFNAMQWVKTVEAVFSSWEKLPEVNKIEVRYENLLSNPRQVLFDILGLLRCTPTERFFSQIPTLKRDNFNKWEHELTAEEIREIKPILTPMLEKTGYLQTSPW
ncbi:MAG: sulfotransferase family protein [Thermodesulfobacteriota bacterium]